MDVLKVLQEKKGLASEEELKQDQSINNPNYYGGKDNVYEAIKIIEALNLGFHLGNVIKYVIRSSSKGEKIEDLKKAVWYLERKIKMEIQK